MPPDAKVTCTLLKREPRLFACCAKEVVQGQVFISIDRHPLSTGTVSRAKTTVGSIAKSLRNDCTKRQYTGMKLSDYPGCHPDHPG